MTSVAKYMLFPKNSPLEDKIKTIEEERVDETGRTVRITRNIRMRLVKEVVKPEIAERRKWRKYGDASSDKPGPDLATTILGEPVFLKLSMKKDLDMQEQTRAAAVETKTLACRHCKGAHWSAKCPHKELFASEELPPKAKPADSTKPAKYVPPSLRNRPDDSAAGTFAQRDTSNTLRFTNLNDQTTEADIRLMCKKFEPLSRVFVSKDPETGLCKGFAFVSFMSRSSAEAALQKLNGHRYGSLIMSVDWAKPSTEK